MFKLVIEDDEGNKTVVPIIRDEITIGRREGNTIRLTERNVSRDHAKLVRREDAVFITELSARYGTKKNGDKIAGEAEFDVGDIFSIGDYRLTLQSDVVTEAKPPPTPNGAAAKAAPAPPPEKARTRPKAEGTEIIATDPARLVIVSSNFAGQEFPLARKEMVIGRGEECDIIIDHRSVSQKHAKVIREQNGEYKIVDLKSKNGVKVGGEEYRAVHLKRGDIVELGHVKFRFVESGENYVFTPQFDDEVVTPTSSKKGIVIGGLVVVALISCALAFVAMRPGETDETPVTNNAPDTIAAVAVTAEQVEENDLDEKIDKAEQDYLAGKVQKAAGMLELLRDDDKVSPGQVERIDSLLSKTKREIGFVRYFENGRDHFEAERWLAALAEFREIPDDDELNIYRLVKEGQYIDKAVSNATAEQLEIAKNAEDEADRDAAGERLAELQAQFPSHVAPPEAIAELEASGGKRPEPRPPVVRRPKSRKDPKPDPKPEPASTKTVEVKSEPANAGDADQLLMEAKQAFFQSKFNTAKSKAKDATKLGCRADCYRVIGMSHYKLGENEQACTWLAKAAGELPADLECP